MRTATSGALSLLLIGSMLLATGAAAEETANKAKVDEVRLYVEGAFCSGCAAVLKDVLESGGVKNCSKIAPNGGRGYVIVLGQFRHEDDLSKVAKLVNAADTPHRKQAKPGVALEVFAKVDKETSPTAAKALAGVDGVDSDRSEVDAARGVISVRLTGEKEVSVSTILAALEKSGIEAEVVTSGRGRFILGEKGEEKKE